MRLPLLEIGLALVAGAVVTGGGAALAPMSPAMGNVHNLSDAFWTAIWEVAGRLHADASVLCFILYEESGINPAAQNSIGCVGINQFCPGTYEGFVSIPKDQYLALAAEDQLVPYVEKYWAAGPAGSLAMARDIFWRSLLPATWKPNADPSTVVNDPAILGASYAAKVAAANPIGQTDPSVITAGDIDRYLSKIMNSDGWAYCQGKLAQFDPSSGSA